MNYFGMPFGMWTLLAKSFRTQLTQIFGYNDESARDITHKAKAKYKAVMPIPFVTNANSEFLSINKIYYMGY